ncbi:DNA adenine methylase [Campylobacter upsaliensis]|nr:DNA adenine methylase [Campylobacter upsaliensis]EHV9438562.1 DNA adenine methylase [Campylobacter upsaliensis]EIB1177440.1 DNA adenine methylase [Campylobacter upsaliensis]EJM3943774.1 DNA adenine methylase [Campylobacter upsaliensis]EKL1657763.1 DNA adenine methylase [Campylobacter upsaliensis]
MLMFSLSNRRYTGAKTRLLDSIDTSILKSFDYRERKNLSFFDVFGGTGVVGEHFAKKKEFNSIIINDFLHSNFIIYQGFFTQDLFDLEKLESFKKEFAKLKPKDIKENYYSKHFGDKFFSKNDSKIIGYVRDRLDYLLDQKAINEKEFYILLSSLLYSVDRVANTVGHYDAYRKNVILQDRFSYELISPLKLEKSIEIYKEDSNVLAQNLAKQKRQIDIAFIDPPYNSRQYSRFYHLLENLALNKKPELYGVALKPKPENLSKYCKVEAKETFKDLIESLAKMCKVLVVTYNNTYSSKSNSSRNKIELQEIQATLEAVSKVSFYEFDFKAFSSGKTNLKEHKEIIFIGEIK